VNHLLATLNKILKQFKKPDILDASLCALKGIDYVFSRSALLKKNMKDA
jgi:hypothetical protein